MMTETSTEANPFGLHPSAVDLSRHPEITQEMLATRIAAGEAAMREAGFDIVPCQVTRPG
ncbi:hypothetical protein [Arthrobacter sp. ISL-5]|uniref:hypothetical protein n=1 Tax=Arthrobacter sp. ISL-5 TaxID=2819111 RepID=UPI001BEA5770|nr:hypothetical protein [Arthrobacter sp. ISL-5]MBT2551559.1 hypothetical protein [Arthrobacter sp. ISL-5]